MYSLSKKKKKKEDGGGETDTLTGGDDEAGFLNKLHRLPLRVAGDGLVQPFVSDCSAVGMASRHERELVAGGGPPVKHFFFFFFLIDKEAIFM